MKFGIIGAGAMGCRFAYSLSKANLDVILVDTWKEHVERIRENGLSVDFNGEEDTISVPIFYPEEVTESVDVVIVLTKSMQLAPMLESVKSLFHENTKAICLLNGLGHQHVMEKYIPKDNVIMGTTIWTAVLEGPGRVILHGAGNLALQNIEPNETAAQQVREIVEVLNQANLQAAYSENVTVVIWRKAIVNCCGNATTALLECQLEGFFGNEYGTHLVDQITKECVAVAAKLGIEIDQQEITEFAITASLKLGEHYSSMYQDLVKNHRLTEVDYLNGYITNLGREFGIPTPYNDTITQFIHIKEQILKVK